MDDDEDIIKILKSRRKYASFFEWPNKELKEMGIAKSFSNSLMMFFNIRILDLKINSKDPPDIICKDNENKKIALEITEIVCRKSIELNQKGKDVYRQWKLDELVGYVQNSLKDKDRKLFNNGPYDKIYVCLFTDELTLSFYDLKNSLESIYFGEFTKITDAFMLFSYDPGIKQYPLLRLKIN